jgi:hypothetical protein
MTPRSYFRHSTLKLSRVGSPTYYTSNALTPWPGKKIRNRGLKISPVKEVPMEELMLKGRDYSSMQPLVYNWKNPKSILRPGGKQYKNDLQYGRSIRRILPCMPCMNNSSNME